MKIQSALWPSLALTLWFIVVTGLAFPLAIFGLSQALFPHQANGSMIKNAKGQVVGSELIGQSFGRPEYFHPRPSAAGSGYDAANSSGTNLGPTSDKLINGIADDLATMDVDESYAGIKQLAEAYRKENNLALAPMQGGERGPGGEVKIPADAVTRSASGLDPHISLANARLQAPRVAQARGLSLEAVATLIEANTDPRFLGIFGEPVVNVLKLNLALDGLRK